MITRLYSDLYYNKGTVNTTNITVITRSVIIKATVWFIATCLLFQALKYEADYVEALSYFNSGP